MKENKIEKKLKKKLDEKENETKTIWYRPWGKVLLFVSVVVSFMLCAISVVGWFFLVDSGAYKDNGKQLKQWVIDNYISGKKKDVSDYYHYITKEKPTNLMDQHYEDIFSSEKVNYCFSVEGKGTKKSFSNVDNRVFQYEKEWKYEEYVEDKEYSESKIFPDRNQAEGYCEEIEEYDYDAINVQIEELSSGEYKVMVQYAKPVYEKIIARFYVPEELSAKDGLYYMFQIIDWGVSSQGVILIAILLFTTLFFASVIKTFQVAGYKGKNEEITLSLFDKLPLDGWFLVLFLALCGTASGDYYMSYLEDMIFVLAFIVPIWCVLVLVTLLTVVKRYKAKKLFDYTAISFCYRGLKKAFCRILGGGNEVISQIPLLWKIGLVWCLELAIEFMFMCWGISGIYSPGFYVIGWMLLRGVLTLIVLGIALQMYQLKKGAKEIAEGNLQSTISTKYMMWDFKEHGENLNHIKEGMEQAVEKSLKSERLKTELITNVSHDIKTPLTSIVNYIDLMKKENISPEIAKEYLQVLDRQSAKLKKLIEDLVEASKASTGNITANMGPTDVKVLVGQMAGEYEERLKEQGIDLVLDMGEEVGLILGDGNLLWRVFDNILNNVCKYAQTGTRVYLSAKERGNQVIITFKNVSKYPLNISSDELMERFVRGDSSRNTEGSGLGLSIAKSLCEVQKGSFELEIDGDLFKTIITFPVMKEK
ncbi:MAG: HAMP domain-containing sensor histidine kinase [Lachnospiraceae bacterium]|nr:HAMP domain-containing sensor histidine kinase [Lachnospiraceae bacterium]